MTFEKNRPQHDNNVTDLYFNELEAIFNKIAECEQNILNIDELINGRVCHSGFKRLN